MILSGVLSDVNTNWIEFEEKQQTSEGKKNPSRNRIDFFPPQARLLACAILVPYTCAAKGTEYYFIWWFTKIEYLYNVIEYVLCTHNELHSNAILLFLLFLFKQIKFWTTNYYAPQSIHHKMWTDSFLNFNRFKTWTQRKWS